MNAPTSVFTNKILLRQYNKAFKLEVKLASRHTDHRDVWLAKIIKGTHASVMIFAVFTMYHVYMPVQAVREGLLTALIRTAVMDRYVTGLISVCTS